VVTDANGCTSSSSVLITEPSQIVLSTSSTDAGCGQPNGTATVIANGGVGGYDYLWNTIPVQTTTTATNLPAASYQVTVTDDNGCSMSATVGVSDVLGPALQIGPIENVSCFGEDDGSIMVFASGGSAPYTFQWSPSGGNDSIATNLIAGVYSVTVTDVGGCVGVLTQTISEPDLLVAQPGPNTAICNGESVLLGGSPVAFGGTPAYSYLWSPAGSLSSATDSMPVAMPTTNTVYTLIVTDGNGCSASAIVSVDVNAIPVMPVITANSDSLFSTTANAYQWYFNGNILNGATSQFYVPQQTGNYSVVITDGNACSAASTDFFFNFSSVGHLMDEGVIEVYPNPAGNSVSIRLLRNEEIEMHIVNLTGERFSVGIAKSSADFFTLDISALANGVYVLEIKFLSTNKISRKIIVKE